MDITPSTRAQLRLKAFEIALSWSGQVPAHIMAEAIYRFSIAETPVPLAELIQQVEAELAR